MKNIYDLNVAEFENIMSQYARDSNKEVRKYGKNCVAIINGESINFQSTMNSTSASIRSKLQVPKKRKK